MYTRDMGKTHKESIHIGHTQNFLENTYYTTYVCNKGTVKLSGGITIHSL